MAANESGSPRKIRRSRMVLMTTSRVAVARLLCVVLASAACSGPLPTEQLRTPSPPPIKSEARSVDPRILAADAKAHVGQNLYLEGNALNVVHHDTYTWVQLMAQVPGRTTTESIVFEFRPKESRLLRDECYRMYGVVAGTQEVTLTMTGAKQQAAYLNGYAWESIGRTQFGTCVASSQERTPAITAAASSILCEWALSGRPLTRLRPVEVERRPTHLSTQVHEAWISQNGEWFFVVRLALAQQAAEPAQFFKESWVMQSGRRLDATDYTWSPPPGIGFAPFHPNFTINPCQSVYLSITTPPLTFGVPLTLWISRLVVDRTNTDVLYQLTCQRAAGQTLSCS